MFTRTQWRQSILIGICFIAHSMAFSQNTPNDGDWKKNYEVKRNTDEADIMIRIGDIDNLNFGWAEGFNPFSGKSTDSHGFPWEPNETDVKGLDRILLGTSFEKKPAPCGGEGYSSMGRAKTVPEAIKIPLNDLKDVTITAATLTMFIDDFQAPYMCSKFQATLNGKRVIELEKILNAVNQTGPIGKFISIKLSEEFLPMFSGSTLSLLIDDPTTSAGDGFALDFVKLLINPKPLIYKGTIVGVVKDKETGNAISNAQVMIKGYPTTMTDAEGKFRLAGMPIGLGVVEASAPQYATGREVFDVIADEETQEKEIFLEKSKSITFGNRKLIEGDAMVMNNIQFSQGSAQLSPAAQAELTKIYDLMVSNPKAEIELSGHTSNEGERILNVKLSKDRVNACKQYIVSKGIDEGRIISVGFGPDKPVASNDTEISRAKNRRVEMRMLRVQ